MYINQHVLSGNIGRDAVLRNAGDSQVASFSIANTSPFGQKNTTWYNVSLFGKQAATLAPMLTKGQQIIVIGETSQREYTDKNGNPQKSLDFRASSIQLVGNRNGNAADNDEEEVESDVDDLF